MARVYVCDECGGTGALGFERGPAVERCSRCRGVGVTFYDASTAARDLRDVLLTTSANAQHLELGLAGAVRAIAATLALVEERLARIETELARRG